MKEQYIGEIKSKKDLHIAKDLKICGYAVHSNKLHTSYLKMCVARYVTRYVTIRVGLPV